MSGIRSTKSRLSENSYHPLGKKSDTKLFHYDAMVKFGYSEKATKLEKIFHLKFDATQ